MRVLAVAAILLLSSASAWADLKVVSSIKPLHSLVAQVMKGAGTPSLLLDGANSPHTYALKPRDAENLQEADVIFWIGPDLESFLEKPLQTLGRRAKILALTEAAGVRRLHVRQGPGFASDDHKHHGTDPHIWLDPDNAKAILAAVAGTLSEADPANAKIYAANAANASLDIDALTQDLAIAVAPAKNQSFIVFHDAYQYFEKRFGLEASGAIALQPDAAPGAKTLRDLRSLIATKNITCVFSEPQFDSKLVSVVIEGTNARAATLDPLGATLDAGPDLYARLMRKLATDLRRCLAP
jgi:zinc transport system substrate-binding protein